MIISRLRMVVRPDRRGDLLETLRGMLEPARVERGCLSYRLYEDSENRNAFVLMEEWATQEDLDRHISLNNQQRIFTLMDLLSEEPEVRFSTVLHTTGMDLIEKVLKTKEQQDQGTLPADSESRGRAGAEGCGEGHSA